MLEKLQAHIRENFPFLENKKLLLATSGGLDSMVMVELFRQLPYEIALAHCNFQLRGVESFEDQKFVENYAEQYAISLFATQFDTTAFAKDYKLSTQVAARDLRYNWFYELIEEEQFDYVLTAHHADDNIETFLINLGRGTGLDGLVGIPSQNDKIIRPLLLFSRIEIADYAAETKLQWREDSSNASNKYLRNKIRHDIVPLLKELNANFLTTFPNTQKYLQEAQAMVEDAAIIVYQQVAEQKDDTIHFDLVQLRRLPNYKSYLYHWLKEFGFTAWNDIYDLVESQSGKQVLSADFRLIKDRDSLLLVPMLESDSDEEFYIEKGVQDVKIPLKLSISKVTDRTTSSNTTIFVDESKLVFPLVLKKWQEGDFFQPFGMNGKTKKLSKLFKDEKLSVVDKENIWILWSADTIVWVVGLRQDERFKIENNTEHILKLEIQ
ncbi:MAG: tRNA lysidine(34) synthetase TilS [Bacteroidetes bacterium]|nr:tRNA lysidine(34) synthetase TilS [Bacteroidota bacterium]